MPCAEVPPDVGGSLVRSELDPEARRVPIESHDGFPGLERNVETLGPAFRSAKPIGLIPIPEGARYGDYLCPIGDPPCQMVPGGSVAERGRRRSDGGLHAVPVLVADSVGVVVPVGLDLVDQGAPRLAPGN